MNCFFCTGPYHTFVSILLAKNEYADQESDCYIFDYFNHARDVYENLKKEKIFKNVYLIEENPGWFHWMKGDEFSTKNVFKKIIYKLKIAKTKLGKNDYASCELYNKKYDRIFTAGFFNFIYDFAIYNAIHEKAKLFVFDDGLSNRTQDFFYNRRQSFADKLFGVKVAGKYVEGVYLFNPKLIVAKHSQKIIKQTAPVPEDILIMKRVFDYDANGEKLKQSKIIYLAGGLEAYDGIIPGAGESAQIEKNILIKLNEKYQNDLIVKAHPLSKINYENINCVKNCKAPFEIICDEPQINNKILISTFSTALFNPKFIYNNEPYIIFLYKVLNLKTETWTNMSSENFDNAIKAMLIDNYSDKSKIAIPNTFQELEETIDRFLNGK